MDDRLETVRNVFEAGSSALAAFDLIVAHALAAGFVLVPRLGRVRSVEVQMRDRRLNPFSAQAHARHVNFYLRRPVLDAHPGMFDEAAARFGSVRENGRREFRTHLRDVDAVESMLAFLRERGAWPSARADRQFVAATFGPVGAEHLLSAARRLRREPAGHGFGPSTDYDVMFDGERLPPKAVFGLAASAALGFPVRPENFRGGEGTVCFRVLSRCGYEIVPKGDEAAAATAGLSDDDRTWAEGRPRLVAHLRRERATGLAAAKRERFRADHGRLFCQRCLMDPVETFGSELGEACIEVHHDAKRMAEMGEGHHTRLEDLRCLCANCHRMVHRELRAAEIARRAGRPAAPGDGEAS